MTPHTDKQCPYCSTSFRDLTEWVDVEGSGALTGFPCCLKMREAMAIGEAGVPQAVSDYVSEATDAKFVGETGTISRGIETEAVSKTEANPIIDRWHRNLDASHMGILGVLARNGDQVVGAATLATPTARGLMQKGTHLEVNRIATIPDDRTWPESGRTLRFNAVSKITARMRKEARRLRRESRRALLEVARGKRLSERAVRRHKRRRGLQKLRTYIFDFESGASMRAAGWEKVGETDSESWDTPARRRDDPKVRAKKKRFDTSL